MADWDKALSRLEEVVARLLSLCIDLVRWKEASDQIRESIEREGVPLYERQ